MRLPAVLVFCLVLGNGIAAHAQLPAARLTTVFPPGGQRGTDVEVTLAGVDLDDLTGLHFSTPALAAESKVDPASGKPVPNVFVIRIGKEVRLGTHDVRAVGRFGVTNPRAFVVDRDPQAVAKPGNTSPEAAIDVAINGGTYAQAADKADQYFKFNLKANRRVSVDVDAIEVDSRMDPVLVLFDSAGREVARDGQRGRIEFTPASDGAYVVQIHDVLYRGGPEYYYRLRVQDGPAVAFLLPPAVRGDALGEIGVFGTGLPGGAAQSGALQRLALNLLDDDVPNWDVRWYVPPTAAMLDGAQRYSFAGAVNPHFVGLVGATLVPEQAENDEPAKAQTLSLPAEVYGQFFPRNDRDVFRFDAKKGESFWVEVISSRLLGFTDPMVVVQRVTKNEKGEETAVDVKEAYEPENIPNMPREFYAAHRDPAFGFAAPEDGTYRVMVRDLFNTTDDDPRRVYTLSIAPMATRQDFRLVAWPQAPQPVVMNPPITQSWGSNLRPGGVMPVSVLAFPTGGFAGDVTLTAEGLPAGVTCPPVVMSAGTNAATLLLAADEKAAPWVGPVRIVGTAAGTGGQRVSHAARAGTFVWTVPNQELEPLRSRVAQQLVVAVSAGEVEPIAVRPAEEKVWENSVAGRIEVPLKVTRRAGYNAAVKLKPVSGLAQLIAMPEFEVAAAAVDGKLTIDAAALKLPPGNYTLHLQATSTAAYDRDPAKRAAVQAAKDAADKATPDLAAAVAKAKEALAAAKTPEEKDAATKAVAAAEEKVKQNEQVKTTSAEQLKGLAPKDTLAYGYSTPITIKITPAPITLAAAVPATPIKPGGKLDVPVTITRLYGFADPVDLTVALPQGVAGISAANVQIAANATQATVSVQAAPDAKPGDYALTLAATLKQNNVPIKVDQPLRVQIAAP